MNTPTDGSAGSRAESLSAPDSVSSDPVVVEVRGLVKSYGREQALAGVDLEVRRGEIFAFLGPNGAGKTTTVEILEGFRRRSGGEVTVLGTDPEHAGGAWRSRIGVVLQESQPEEELTVAECVSLYAGYYPTSRPVSATLELVGLSDRPEVRCRDLSGGQRRRLDVALALIGDPELVFLDEPTTGFDPASRRATWEIIAGLRDLGKTIFLTTHYMEEAEFLADRIAVIARGRIVAEGTSAGLGDRSSRHSKVSFTVPDGLAFSELSAAILPDIASSANGRVEIRTDRALALVGALSSLADERGIDLPDLEVTRPTLEDVYLELTEDAG